MNVANLKKSAIGTAIPVGALRSNVSIGVGEFLDLIEFARLCANTGISLIQLLPVNDTGYESSPYSALTAFALNPLYIRISEIPEAAAFSKDISAIKDRFAGETRFPYREILSAKMNLLRKIYAAGATPGTTLSAWIHKNPWVIEYAVFRRLKESNKEKSWKEWPAYSCINKKDIKTLWDDKTLESEHLFWAWLQWHLDDQFSAAAKAVKEQGIILEGDIPILMNEDSADVWAHGEYFQQNFSAGAPPDMYSPDGQNWGFPIYDWDNQAKDDYAWWRNRLKSAEKYYDAYRIDHVLGFFRIWACSRNDVSATLGRYIPYIPLNDKDFEKLEFSKERIRWLSKPHIPTQEINDILEKEQNTKEVAITSEQIFTKVLDRIGNEELWLFKDCIKGEKDIYALNLLPAAQNFLIMAWHNRLFLEYEKGTFFPTWYCRDSRAYHSLSEKEREELESLLDSQKKESEQIWEEHGKRLLQLLTAASPMLPCAEDLGAVPDCVPKVLEELEILGLRVLRWNRMWDKEEQPYVPFNEYPELSVATPAVHDSSTVREWWENEADQETFCTFIGEPALPKTYTPGVARKILGGVVSARSRFKVFQIQDLLHLSSKWYAKNPESERINIPGTLSDFNWTYRLPAPIEEISKDTDFINAVKALCSIKPESRRKS